MAQVHASLPAEAVRSVKSAAGVDKDALIDRLDALLEQYLHTLDEYERLMQQLSKQLSSGYFSLTQANFHNRSGVRYGQDSYDERVQATAKIMVTEDEESKLCYATISKLPFKAAANDSIEEEKQSKQSEDPAAKLDSKDASANAEETTETTEESPETAEGKDGSPEPKAVNPIRMFGILVPPALRSAQASLREAVDGPIPRLASVTGELRTLEREIGRARKAVRKA